MDITFGAPHTQTYRQDEAGTTRQTEIDLVEEHNLTATLQHARYEQQLRRYHDRNMQERDFHINDLVLRRIQSTVGSYKLSSPWEGPFIVSSMVVPGTYRLHREDGTDVGNLWNIEHLLRFYP